MTFASGAQRGTWEFRRNLTIRTLQFCAGVIAVCITLPILNAEVAKTAITSAFSLAAGVVMSYLAAAGADDHLSRPRPVAPVSPILVKPPVTAKDEEIG